MTLLAVSIVSKSSVCVQAENRANKTLLRTLKTSGEIYRLCAIIPDVFLLDSH